MSTDTEEPTMISSRAIAIAAITTLAAAAAVAIPPATQPGMDAAADRQPTIKPSLGRSSIREIAGSGYSEIALGHLATDRAIEPQVRR